MEVGEILHQAKSGRIIIKLIKDIKVGDVLTDSKGKKLVKVVEIIGPVNTPYASATPLTDRIKKYIGTKVYVKR
jgi:RNA-binding protein